MDIKEALTFDGLKYFYTKYIKPLKTGAFSTVVNNATTTVANTVLDGRMGKTLADKDANLQNQIDTLNSSLANIAIRRVKQQNLTVDGKMYEGETSLIYIELNEQGRYFALGFIYGSFNQEVWSKYINQTRLLVLINMEEAQKEWFSIRSGLDN